MIPDIHLLYLFTEWVIFEVGDIRLKPLSNYALQTFDASHVASGSEPIRRSVAKHCQDGAL